MYKFAPVTSKKTYWLTGIILLLLISLIINQVIYVYNAALEQEYYFNDKATMALESIVNEFSDDYDVCQNVNVSIGLGCNISCTATTNSTCSTDFKSQSEWQSVDSIIRAQLIASNIDLTYNFDFCNSLTNTHDLSNKNTYSKDLDNILPKSGIIMYLEFPSKSRYILSQIGPTFISSILLIILITIVYAITFQFYRKEKIIAQRTKEFLNNMTHEFKTPLANIAFANSLIRKQSHEITPDKIKKYTQIIQSENDKIIDSSEDILEMAKQEYDFKNMVLEDVEVHEILQDLQSSFISTHINNDVSIRLNLGANLNTVKGKISFLRNALSNLIDNSIKYCQRSPIITVSTHSEKEFLVISIEDNGIGIPKKDIDAVFNKFYRVSTGNQHDVKGFGLGLSYVKVTIEQMKGHVSLKSHLGKGSVFTIKLPVVHA